MKKPEKTEEKKPVKKGKKGLPPWMMKKDDMPSGKPKKK